MSTLIFKENVGYLASIKKYINDRSIMLTVSDQLQLTVLNKKEKKLAEYPKTFVDWTASLALFAAIGNCFAGPHYSGVVIIPGFSIIAGIIAMMLGEISSYAKKYKQDYNKRLLKFAKSVDQY